MEIQLKRRPIQRKIRHDLLVITLVSVLIMTLVVEFCFFTLARSQRVQITGKLQSDLVNITENKAENINILLQQYLSFTQGCAEHIHEMYNRPTGFQPRFVDWADPKNNDVFTMQKTLRDTSVDDDALLQEQRLLGNLESSFTAFHHSDGGIVTMYYLATESGFMLHYDAASALKAESHYYDYSQKSWYRDAREQGHAFFTDVYEDGYGRGLTITCAAPFYDADQQFAGVVAMDILVSDAFDSLLKINMENTEALLVDNDGRLISTEQIGLNFRDDPLLDENTFRKIMDSKTDISLTDKGYYYAYAPIKATSWHYCLRINEHEMLQVMYIMKAAIILMNILFVIVDIIIIAVIMVYSKKSARKLTMPLIDLRNDAQKISEGDFDHHAIVHDNDEIGDLAKDFNSMAASLKQYIEDIKKVTAEKERIGAELNVATQIQADMLPRIFPAFPERNEFDIYATMDPAKEVGGDFYDFFLIDEKHLALVMADVSGKGVPAALFMVIAKTLIKNRAIMGKGTPSEILYDVNNQLCEGNDAELFVTVWLAILDLETGKGIAANAGHENPAVRRKDGTFELIKNRHSPAVATMENMKFREHEFELFPGDTLFVYTDGVAEATNADNKLYGTDRMVEALDDHAGAALKDMLQGVRQSIDAFVGEAPQFDDITMLGFRYFGTGESTEESEA
ncbi:MAG: SpoIIE family protein phosphatase [Oscillospiraceae bacterium]|nr:SpoIIE family protein phosphatase [Oscillospiraceae bacterium]